MCLPENKIEQNSAHRGNFNFYDFHERWMLARKTSILSVVSISNSESDLSALDEEALLTLVSESDRSGVLRAVFDNSRKLGISLRRYLNRPLRIDEVEYLLSHGSLACVAGHWKNGSLTRPGCNFGKTIGSFYCLYIKDAVDGFVCGATLDIRHTRFQSLPSGDSLCEDVLLFENEYRHNPFGRLPEYLKPLLTAIESKVNENYGVNLKWCGLSEGVLHIQIWPGKTVACGASKRLLVSELQRQVSAVYPRLHIRDATPAGVLKEGGA